MNYLNFVNCSNLYFPATNWEQNTCRKRVCNSLLYMRVTNCKSLGTFIHHFFFPGTALLLLLTTIIINNWYRECRRQEGEEIKAIIEKTRKIVRLVEHRDATCKTEIVEHVCALRIRTVATVVRWHCMLWMVLEVRWIIPAVLYHDRLSATIEHLFEFLFNLRIKQVVIISRLELPPLTYHFLVRAVAVIGECVVGRLLWALNSALFACIEVAPWSSIEQKTHWIKADQW